MLLPPKRSLWSEELFFSRNLDEDQNKKRSSRAADFFYRSEILLQLAIYWLDYDIFFQILWDGQKYFLGAK